MFITYHCLNLWYMDEKMVMDVRIKKNLKFQVRFISNLVLNMNKAFREKLKVIWH